MRDSPATPSQPNAPFVVGALVRYVVKSAIDAGISMERLLETAGLEPDLLLGNHAQLPSSCLEKLIAAAASISGDSLIGLHLSEHSSQEGFGVLGYIRQACASLREVIDMTMRYEGLVSNIGKTSLQYEPGVALWCFRLQMESELSHVQGLDYMLGCWHTTLLRLLPQADQALLRVHLTHPAPSSSLLSEYERVFRCPVHFNQAVCALVLAADALDWPLAHPDIALQQTLEKHAQQLLQRDVDSFPQQVRTQLAALIRRGQASREKLAASLNMSPRHLGRRLQHESINYRQLLNEQRQQLVEQYLLDEQQSVEAVAKRLGFSESQSFVRWFRKQTDMTPGQFRRQATRSASQSISE